MDKSEKFKPQPNNIEAENKNREKNKSSENRKNTENDKNSGIQARSGNISSNNLIHNQKNIKHDALNDNSIFEKIYLNIKQVFSSQSQDNFRKDIEDILERNESSNVIFTPSEKAIFKNSISFANLRVEDVMVPRADIIAIDENDTIKNLHNIILKAGHSRIPVYRETLDDPQYVIHIKDLLNLMSKKVFFNEEDKIIKSKKNTNSKPKTKSKEYMKDGELDSFLKGYIKDSGLGRKLIFAPPSMTASNLLLKMQTERSHLAIVVDEYGGTDGLVSIEDLIEEVVGNIEDEHDNNGQPLITMDDDDCYIAQSRTPLDEFENIIGRRLFTENEFDNYDTLGGIVFSIAGRVPNRGELIYHEKGIEFEVIDGDPRKINRLKIRLKNKNKKKKGSDLVEAAE